MQRYWLSWYQPTDDYRPLTYPPNDAIRGWWNSGQRLSDDAWTICAVVDAEDEASAWEAVRVDWPEAHETRFCRLLNMIDEREELGDRFPPSDWMIERLLKLRGTT